MTLNLEQQISGVRGHWLALMAGMALPLAFSPFNYFPVALISLALLFLTWQADDYRFAARRGFLFGLGMFGVGVSWVYVAIHDFGQASMLVAGLLTLLFISIFSLYLAGIGWLIKRYASELTPNINLIFLFPLLWLGFEAFKAWFLTGFPWLEVGISQINGPLHGFTPVIGVLGVSLLTAISAGLLAASLLSKRVSYFLLFGMIWLAGAMLSEHEWTQAYDEPVQVSIIQGNIAQEIKWDREQIYRTLALYQQRTEQHWDSDLVVWPENAVTVFYHQAEEFFIEPLAEKAREHDTAILLGLPVLDRQTDKYYNAMASIGDEQGVYFKQHLVPFGDYVPFEWLRGLIAFFDLPMSSFSAGTDQQPLLKVAGHKVGISICYEDVFSSEIRTTVPEAGFFVNATNNAWYGDSFAPHQHLQISQNRSLEMGRPTVRSTTNGISAFIDHHGQIVAKTAQFEEAVLTNMVQPRHGATPYVSWGYLPIIILSLFMFTVWAYYRRIVISKKS